MINPWTTIGQTIAVIGGGIDLSVSAVITVTAIILPLALFLSLPFPNHLHFIQPVAG